jgi:hypothetical protein
LRRRRRTTRTSRDGWMWLVNGGCGAIRSKQALPQ